MRAWRSPSPACGERTGARGRRRTPAHPAGSRPPPPPTTGGTLLPAPFEQRVGVEVTPPERCARESQSPAANRRRSSAITIASASLSSPSGRPPSGSFSARSSTLIEREQGLVSWRPPPPPPPPPPPKKKKPPPPHPPVRLLDRNPLAQRPGDDRAEMALHPRPPARVARLAGLKARRDRRPAIAGALTRGLQHSSACVAPLASCPASSSSFPELINPISLAPIFTLARVLFFRKQNINELRYSAAHPPNAKRRLSPNNQALETAFSFTTSRHSAGR